jgi:hypothetical protein
MGPSTGWQRSQRSSSACRYVSRACPHAAHSLQEGQSLGALAVGVVEVQAIQERCDLLGIVAVRLPANGKVIIGQHPAVLREATVPCDNRDRTSGLVPWKPLFSANSVQPSQWSATTVGESFGKALTAVSPAMSRVL